MSETWTIAGLAVAVLAAIIAYLQLRDGRLRQHHGQQKSVEIIYSRADATAEFPERQAIRRAVSGELRDALLAVGFDFSRVRSSVITFRNETKETARNIRLSVKCDKPWHLSVTRSDILSRASYKIKSEDQYIYFEADEFPPNERVEIYIFASSVIYSAIDSINTNAALRDDSA